MQPWAHIMTHEKDNDSSQTLLLAALLNAREVIPFLCMHGANIVILTKGVHRENLKLQV